MDPVKTLEPPKNPLSELENPVLPPLNSRMTVDLVVDEKSRIWLLHDRPFSEIVKWIEYDLDLNTMCLIMVSGRQQAVGLIIPPEMEYYIGRGREVYLVQMKNKKIVDCGATPLMVRGTVH